MASITVTVASVVRATGQTTAPGTAGETITAGQPLYLKASDSRYWLADGNLSAEGSTIAGISLHASLAGQPITFMTSGPVTLGVAAMTVGQAHYLHTTAGLISDGQITGYQSLIGVAQTTDILYVHLWNSGIQKA